MSRSKQRSHCQHSCWMCDPGKNEPGTAKPSDRRRMQPDDGDIERDELAASDVGCVKPCCATDSPSQEKP